jgi:hypothetical protein
MRPAPWTAWGLACIYAALGDNDAAFRWLSFEPAHAWIPWARTSSLFHGLRDDPRFDELLQRFHLPTTSAGTRPARA